MNDMKTIYAWTEKSPEGMEGVIFTYIPLLGMSGTLQHRSLEIARKLQPIAEEHKKKTGHQVHLVQFNRHKIIDTL